MSPDRAAVHELNARAREGAVTDDYFGTAVEDPYRSLEEESAATSAWIDAQTQRTTRALDRLANPVRRERLARLLGIGVVAQPSIAGDLVFYTKRDGDREQPALCVLPLRAAPGTAPRVLVDPQALGERVALDWYEPSPRGKFVAYGLSDNGDERSTLHVIEVATGTVQPVRIPRTKWSHPAWLPDESGFYYTRYPQPNEPGWDPDAEDTYFPRLFFHALGTEPAADPLVYGSERGTDFLGADVSEDGRWVVVNVFRGWSASDVYLVDRRARDARPVPVVTGRENLTTGRVLGGKLLLLTNIDAPRYRIAAANPRNPADAARPETWRDVIPQGEGAIEAFTASADRLVVHTIEEVRSVLRLYRLDGRPAGTLELPARGSVEGLAASPRGHHVAVAWSSFFYPPALYGADLRSAGATLGRLDAVTSDIDTSAYELEQASVPSRDGTPINVFLVHRRGLPRDGSSPVLLTGYGGFNVPLLPGFARNALYWLERGGVYAVANLRGGSEGGEQWHRAGALGNKERVFEDFEAVIRWLSSSGVSRPDRIGITGGSNGGLLMGAMLTRAPETFGATAAYVGLYDMLRYDRFPPAEIWATEYGSARTSREQFEWLQAYSPYHRIREGVRYPSVLIETADHDSRVYWGHSTKFAARLQEATASDRAIWFYMERRVGHGAGIRLTDLVRRYDRMYAFLEDALGVSRDEAR